MPQIGKESDTIQQRKMKEKSDAGFETETDSDTVLVEVLQSEWNCKAYSIKIYNSCAKLSNRIRTYQQRSTQLVVVPARTWVLRFCFITL